MVPLVLLVFSSFLAASEADALFQRRASLVLCAQLPTVAEARAPGERTQVIEALLARPAHADLWALHWSDLLRVKSEFPANLWPLGAVATHRWLRASLAADLPYDRYVTALVTATGSGFRDGAVNLYRGVPERTPEAWAANVALVFLGWRLEDAALHHGALRGYAATFSGLRIKGTGEWKEEIVVWDPTATPAVAAAAPDGSPLEVAPGADARQALATWLTSGPGAPHLARALVNRTWAWLHGTALHEPVDDLHDVPLGDGPLDRIAAAWRNDGWSQRALVRRLAMQADFLGDGPRPVRRLDAETLLDAINQALGSGERYVSPIPEPFTVLPPGFRAVLLPDASIGSTFLETFGRPARNTPLASERSNTPTVMQAQRLLSSVHLQQKLKDSAWLRRLSEGTMAEPALVGELYLRLLSRLPSPEERAVCLAALRTGDRRQAVEDIAWALINTTAFVTVR